MSRIRLSVARIAGSIVMRAAFSIALLVLVFSVIDFHAAIERLRTGDGRLLIAAVAVLSTAFLIGAVRWHSFLVAAGGTADGRRTLTAFYAGLFATNLLPAGLGGDAVRGWRGSLPGERTRAFASIILDRVTILICAFLLGWMAVVMLDDVPSRIVLALAAASTALLAAVGLTAAGAHAARVFRGRLPGRLAAIGRDASPAVRATLTSGRLLVWTTALGLGYEALTVLSTWLVARSIDVDVSFLALAAVMPSVLLLSALPVSIGGLGVREISYVTLLAPLGVDATDATLMSILATAAYVIASAPGAVALVARR